MTLNRKTSTVIQLSSSFVELTVKFPMYTYDMTRAYLLAYELINPLKLKQIIHKDLDIVPMWMNIRVQFMFLPFSMPMSNIPKSVASIVMKVLDRIQVYLFNLLMRLNLFISSRFPRFFLDLLLEFIYSFFLFSLFFWIKTNRNAYSRRGLQRPGPIRCLSARSGSAWCRSHGHRNSIVYNQRCLRWCTILGITGQSTNGQCQTWCWYRRRWSQSVTNFMHFAFCIEILVFNWNLSL